MKTFAVFALAVIVTLLAVRYSPQLQKALIQAPPKTDSPRGSSTAAGSGPEESLHELASMLPSRTAEGFAVSKISYDVRKADSLITPLIGVIDFTEGNPALNLNFEMGFQWKNDHWVFARLINVENGRDFTELPGGIAILASPGFKELLAKCGYHPPMVESENINPAPAAPSPPPGAWMWDEQHQTKRRGY